MRRLMLDGRSGARMVDLVSTEAAQATRIDPAQVLRDAIHALAHADSVDATERVILTQLRALTRARATSLLTLSDDGGAIVRATHEGPGEELPETWIPGKPAPNGIVRASITSQHASVMQTRESGEPDVVLPLVDGGRVRAVACAFGAQIAKDALRDADLQALTEVFAMGLARARGAAGAQATERLQELQQQLAGILGHDLRNPLAALMISAGVLSRAKDLDSRHLETLSRMSSSASRMKAMLADMVDYVQVRAAGALPFLPSEVDVMGSLRRVIVEAERASGRSIRVHAPSTLLANVDPDRIDQAVAVLLSNAFAHGQKEGPVDLTVTHDGRALTIAVANQGTLSDDTRSALYLARRKGKNPGTRALGLGLFLAREIARVHGGSLDESVDGDTVTFTLRIPLGLTDAAS